MRIRLARRAITLVAVFLVALASAPAALADGEVGDVGDTDSITDLYVQTVSGYRRITARIDNVKDCPTGLSCSIEYRFLSKCPEFYCGWTAQSWRAVPAPTSGVSTVRASCLGSGNEQNYWAMEYRVHWWAGSVKTVELWGEIETLLTSRGTVGRLIAEAMFNVTNNAGLRYGTKIETASATEDYSSAKEVATSYGTVFVGC